MTIACSHQNHKSTWQKMADSEPHLDVQAIAGAVAASVQQALNSSSTQCHQHPGTVHGR